MAGKRRIVESKKYREPEMAPYIYTNYSILNFKTRCYIEKI